MGNWRHSKPRQDGTSAPESIHDGPQGVRFQARDEAYFMGTVGVAFRNTAYNWCTNMLHTYFTIIRTWLWSLQVKIVEILASCRWLMSWLIWCGNFWNQMSSVKLLSSSYKSENGPAIVSSSPHAKQLVRVFNIQHTQRFEPPIFERVSVYLEVSLVRAYSEAHEGISICASAQSHVS